MRVLALATLAALVGTAFMATPVAAEDPCTDYFCVDPSTEFCLALTQTCHSASDVGARDLYAWLEEQLGPCTCDPQPDPW